MKDYLMQFRDQVFSGAMSLYKRTFLSFLLLNIFVGIISLLVFTPLVLKLMGWQLSNLVNQQEMMAEMNKTIMDGGDPSAAFSELFSNAHPEYLLPMILFGLLIYSWSFNLYYTLNDREVRAGNNGLSGVLKASFSRQILNIMSFSMVYYLLAISSLMIFLFAIGLLMSVSKFLGIIVGFFGFFFLLFFLIRFSLGPAAIAHGKMTLSQAFTFSYSKLSMKRSALLLLMGIVLLVVIGIIGSFAGLVVNLMLNKQSSDPVLYYSVSQIMSTLMGAIAGAFLFAGSSALYFRYSDDEVNDETSEHLLTD